MTFVEMKDKKTIFKISSQKNHQQISFLHSALSFLNTGSVPLLHPLVLLQVRWVVAQNGQPQTSLIPGQTSSDGEHAFYRYPIIRCQVTSGILKASCCF
jgi:hypothetical protein